MDYILNWSDGIGRVSAGKYLYDIVVKPVVGFEFDALYYETPTNMAMKILNGEQISLTETEQVKCRQYCEAFHDSDDFKVLAIDPEFRIFKGFMTRGECNAKGYEEVSESLGLDFPEFPLVKLVDGKWERVVACITEQGKLILLPEGDNPKFNFFFTEEEWKNHAKPTYAFEEYNFATGKWEDVRKIDSSRDRALMIVRNMKSRELDKFNLANDMNDPVLYLVQAMEASNYKTDSTVATPFIDSVVSNMQSETKESFMARVLAHYDPEYLSNLGAIHGKYQQIIDSVKSCTTVQELDSIMDSLDSSEDYKWKIVAQVDPYASANENIF